MASAVAAILTVSVLAFALPSKGYALAAPSSTTVVIKGGNGGTGGAGGSGGTGGDGGIAVANTGGISLGKDPSTAGTGSAHASANGGDANGGHGGNANGGSVHINLSPPTTAKMQ